MRDRAFILRGSIARIHPLRDKMVEVYEEMYGQKPNVVAIHAGLECGLFYKKMEGLDCVSLGPDMKDIHTSEEVLSISSTERVWKYLVKFWRLLKSDVGSIPVALWRQGCFFECSICPVLCIYCIRMRN